MPRGRIKSYTYTCIYCGKEYHPKAKERNKYCSRECAYKHKRAEPVEKVNLNKVCVICGKTFITKQKNQKSCSSDCQKEYNRQYNYEHTLKPKICRWCGIEYIPEYKSGIKGYCCPMHSMLAKKEQHKIHKKKQGKLHKGPISKAKRNRIYLRDGHTCQLCGKKLQMNKAETLGTGKPHPLAPTVDHIIPKSIAKEQGWSNQQINAESNLQAAHFICNIKKGNKANDEQLLLFG